MSLRGLRVEAEAMRRLAFGGIGAAFAPIGTGFSNETRITVIENATDVNLTFSLDGVTEWLDLSAGGTATFDWCTNKTTQSEALVRGAFEPFYVRRGPDGAAPTLGRVNVSMVYGAV